MRKKLILVLTLVLVLAILSTVMVGCFDETVPETPDNSTGDVDNGNGTDTDDDDNNSGDKPNPDDGNDGDNNHQPDIDDIENNDLPEAPISQGLEYELSADGKGYICTGIGTFTGNRLRIPDTYNDLPVIAVGESAFYQVASFITVDLPDTIKYIEEQAFCLSGGIISITLPTSLKSIGDEAFGSVKLVEVINLSSLDIKPGSAEFGAVAEYAKNVHTVVPEHDNFILLDDYIFYEYAGKYSLIAYIGSDQNITLPYDIYGNEYDIYDGAFIFNMDINSVIIDGKVMSIGLGSFANCDNLTTVKIFANITNIGSYAFGENEINAVYIKNLESWFNIKFEDRNSNPMCSGADLYLNNKLVTEVVVPDGVESLNYTFSGCQSLRSITIPESVTSIGDSAFRGCYKLIEVCDLAGLGLEAGSTDHGYVAYYAKQVLDSVPQQSNFIEQDDYLFYNNDSEYYLLAYLGNNTKLTLPQSIYGNGYTIYQYAFDHCNSLTTITIPASVTSIGDIAFSGCTNLQTVTFAENSQLKIIDINAFSNCKSLTSITIPAGVTSIGNGAFIGCTNLQTVTFAENSQLKIIDNNAFSSCKSLTSITIPAGVTSIGNGAFIWCTNLQTVTFGDNSQLQSIGASAFSDCFNLTSIIIPASATSIGDIAFSGCTNLQTVYYGGTSEQWADILIESDNNSLTSATIYYYSESNPFVGENAVSDGNYWHYVAGEPVIWTKEQ